uniref:Uncharacterized protein n=1 Tax=Anguilla anguilla TaxID=7936 RepID=A0A0E9TUE7_ANGAN
MLNSTCMASLLSPFLLRTSPCSFNISLLHVLL